MEKSVVEKERESIKKYEEKLAEQKRQDEIYKASQERSKTMKKYEERRKEQQKEKERKKEMMEQKQVKNNEPLSEKSKLPKENVKSQKEQIPQSQELMDLANTHDKYERLIKAGYYTEQAKEKAKELEKKQSKTIMTRTR